MRLEYREPETEEDVEELRVARGSARLRSMILFGWARSGKLAATHPGCCPHRKHPAVH